MRCVNEAEERRARNIHEDTRQSTDEELPDIDKSYDQVSNDKKLFNYIIANARSVLPKIHSVYENFNEQKLSFALITETWLKEGNSKMTCGRVKDSR